MQVPPVQQTNNSPGGSLSSESNVFISRVASLATYLQIPQEAIPRILKKAVPPFLIKSVKSELKITEVVHLISSNPTLLLAMKLSWIQRGFQEILKPLGWPKFTPEPFSSYFIAVKLLLEKIDQTIKMQDIPQRDQLKNVFDIFNDEFEKYQPSRECFYPAEIYFIALNIMKNSKVSDDHRSNPWCITVSPSEGCICFARRLVENTDLLFELLQNCHEVDFYKAFDAFDESWENFIKCLVKEKHINSRCWCGTMMLNVSLRRLAKDKIFLDRIHKIEELVDQFPDNLEAKEVMSNFYVLISYMVNKKIRQLTSPIYMGLLSSPIAELLVKFSNDAITHKALDKMMKEKEIVLIDMILQLACLELSDLNENPESCPPLFRSQFSEVLALQNKIKNLRFKYSDDVVKIIQKHIFESHAELLENKETAEFSEKQVLKTLETKVKEDPIILSDITELRIEEEIVAICLTIYHQNLKRMGEIIDLLLLDFRMLYLVREVRITLLAQSVIDLGIKTYDSTAFDSGFVKEVSLLRKSDRIE